VIIEGYDSVFFTSRSAANVISDVAASILQIWKEVEFSFLPGGLNPEPQNFNSVVYVNSLPDHKHLKRTLGDLIVKYGRPDQTELPPDELLEDERYRTSFQLLWRVKAMIKYRIKVNEDDLAPLQAYGSSEPRVQYEYDAYLCSPQLYEITLATLASPEENDHCSWLLNVVASSCLGADPE
jgi:hypothetical protein